MRRRYGKDEVNGENNVLLWVAPGSIRYDREDIDFLLPWLSEMCKGIGPAEPDSGYVGGKSNRRHSAPHEAWCQVAAEIDNRLSHTGHDLYLVEDFYCRGLDDEDIAIKIFMPTWEVRRRINSAVSYIASGPCPRWLNCIDCSEYQTCRRKSKGRMGITYRDWVRSRSRYHAAEINKAKSMRLHTTP